jgi:hypothetical protein
VGKERDRPQTAADVPEGPEPRPTSEGAQGAAEPRPWWHRWFGFE